MVAPRPGEHLLRTEDIVEIIQREKIALVLLPGIQYSTGQVLDMPLITQVAHENVRAVFFSPVGKMVPELIAF